MHYKTPKNYNKQRKMTILFAYYVRVFNIPEYIVLNLDQTELKISPLEI